MCGPPLEVDTRGRCEVRFLGTFESRLIGLPITASELSDLLLDRLELSPSMRETDAHAA